MKTYSLILTQSSIQKLVSNPTILPDCSPMQFVVFLYAPHTCVDDARHSLWCSLFLKSKFCLTFPILFMWNQYIVNGLFRWIVICVTIAQLFTNHTQYLPLVTEKIPRGKTKCVATNWRNSNISPSASRWWTLFVTVHQTVVVAIILDTRSIYRYIRVLFYYCTVDGKKKTSRTKSVVYQMTSIGMEFPSDLQSATVCVCVCRLLSTKQIFTCVGKKNRSILSQSTAYADVWHATANPYTVWTR